MGREAAGSRDCAAAQPVTHLQGCLPYQLVQPGWHHGPAGSRKPDAQFCHAYGTQIPSTGCLALLLLLTLLSPFCISSTHTHETSLFGNLGGQPEAPAGSAFAACQRQLCRRNSLLAKNKFKKRHFLQRPGFQTTLHFHSDCTKLSERKQKQATNYSLAALGRALSTSEVCSSPSRSSLPVTHQHLAGSRLETGSPPHARCSAPILATGTVRRKNSSSDLKEEAPGHFPAHLAHSGSPPPVTLFCCSSGSSTSLPQQNNPALQKQMGLCWISDPNQPRAAEQHAMSRQGRGREAEAAPRSSTSLAVPCTSTNSPARGLRQQQSDPVLSSGRF